MCNAIWTYINHARLWQFVRSLHVQFDKALMLDLKLRGYVDALGMPQRIETPEPSKHSWTVYDYLPYHAAHQVHDLLCKAVDELIIKAKPIDLDAIWKRRDIRALLIPGTFCFSMRAFYFRKLHRQRSTRTEERLAYAKANGIRVELRLSTLNMFGDSAIHDSFTGRRCAAALFMVKSVDLESSALVIRGTPVAFGCGFMPVRTGTPYSHPVPVMR